MTLKIGRILGVLCAAFMISAALALNIFGETFNSNIFTAEQKNTFGDFRGKSVETTANLNWQTKNGNKITKTTVKNLPSYLLTVNAANDGREKAAFISSPKEALDMSRIGQLYFVVQYAADEKVEYTVKLTLGDGADQLVCTAPLKGNSRQLVSFEIGFFSFDRKINELSLEFFSESSGGKISISGPYYIEIDRTYAQDFSLGDIVLSPDSTYTDEGFFIVDSTQKTGFSGRFLRTAQSKVNHLRLFITTGNVGGTLEIRYSYLNESSGSLNTKSVNVALENASENNSYIVPLENSEKIVSLAFLFDVARSGGITVHGIEAVEIYPSSSQKRYGEISQCSYNAGEGTLTVKGKIFHDFLIKHTSYTLYLYRLEISETLQNAMESGKKPVASAKMSSEFKMTYNAGRQDKLSALSLYTVVASDGEDCVEILPPFHVDKNPDSTESDKSRIKGFCGDNVSCFAGMGVGVSIVDVYLDRLFSEKKSGYIYSLGSTHVYFDSGYIHALDKQVKNLCVAGCSVYLRLLIGENGAELPFASKAEDDVQYFAIDVANEAAKMSLFAAVDFLTGRYSDHTIGHINGYIIGRSADLTRQYHSISDLADQVALTMETVALSAAISMADSRIIVPISIDETVISDYDPELFLTSLCNRLHENGGLDFSVMLESSQTYFPSDNWTEFDDRLSHIERMMSKLSAVYKSMRNKYIYSWTPYPAESEDRLKAAYVYLYMSLLASENCETFLLSTNRTQDSELVQLVKYIDTEKIKNEGLSDFVLDTLGVEKWDELAEVFYGTKIPVRTYGETSNDGDVSASGRYSLFDFSSSFSTLGWFAGDGCLTLSMTMDSGKKYLCASMENYDGHSELAYHFDYPENLSMAPCIAIDFSVGSAETEKYSVIITVRSGNNVLEASDIFTGGIKNRFTVDISSVAETIDSVSICVSALEGVSDNYDFRMSSVSVLSENMTDKELSESIEKARAQAGHHANISTGENEKTPDYEFVIVLVGILAVCVVVVGIYDRNKEK